MEPSIVVVYNKIKIGESYRYVLIQTGVTMLQTSVLFSTGWDRKYIIYPYIYF